MLHKIMQPLTLFKFPMIEIQNSENSSPMKLVDSMNFNSATSCGWEWIKYQICFFDIKINAKRKLIKRR